MSYLSALIAWFMMRTSILTGNAWWDAYLDQLVVVETWFFNVSWWVLLAIVIVAIALFALGAMKRRGERNGVLSGGMCVGCGAVFLALWPFWEWVTLSLAQGMAGAYGPEGIINQGKFIMSLILYILLGAG